MTVSVRNLALVQPLRLRDFRRVWLGESVSMLGDQFYLVALPWLTLELTGSTLALGMVLMAAAIPRAALMLLGGAIADRVDPRVVMIGSSLARAVLVAVLAVLIVTDAVQLWHLYLLGAAFGAADAFYQPAALALIPGLVCPDRLEASNALVTGSMALTNMLGPAVAGIAVAVAGSALGFGIDAASFVVAVLALVSVRHTISVRDRSPESVPGNALSAIRDGLRYVRGDIRIRTVLLAVAIINLAVVGPFFVGLPAEIEAFAGGPMDYGVLLSAWGAAALAGALVAGSLGEHLEMAVVVPLASAAMAGSLILIGLAPNLAFATVAAVPLGAGVGALQVSGMAWLQRQAEPEMRGRVMSLVMLAIMGLTPVSYAVAGAIAEVGVEPLFIGAGLILLALAGATWRTSALRAEVVAG